MARRSLKGWSNLHPPKAHPPITYGLACVVAAELSRIGHPGAAVGVLLSYDCYLRVSELAALRVRDITRLGEMLSWERPERVWAHA